MAIQSDQCPADEFSQELNLFLSLASGEIKISMKEANTVVQKLTATFMEMVSDVHKIKIAAERMSENNKDNSVLKNEIVTFKSQYNDLNRIASQGILGYEQIEIGYNKIRQSLLGLIDRMEDVDVGNKTDLPQVQNNELQNRKENFFELLKIHFNNLEGVQAVLQM